MALQRDLLCIGTTEAKKRAQRAVMLHPARDGAGERAAAAPLTAHAAAEGRLNPGQVDAIGDVMAAIPAAVAETDRVGYEKVLVDLGQQAEPAVMRRAGRHLLALLDPDGAEPDADELADPERALLWSWTRHNQFKLRGTLDAETGQLLETLLSALAKPRQDVDGMPDRRSAGQRQGDAFAELLDYTQRAAERPVEAGETPVVTVLMSLDQLFRRDRDLDHTAIPHEPCAATMSDLYAGTPTLNWELPLTAEQARRLACDARIVPAVLGAAGEILDLGRETRTATRAQRRALAARDGGCVMCSRTVRWCQVHHITEWAQHGTSDMDNLCLLCSACHRTTPAGTSGWPLTAAPNAGRPPGSIRHANRDGSPHPTSNRSGDGRATPEAAPHP